MSYPSYSIVIPTYNEAARISNALESVIACVRQRDWNAEVVVVDDGSRDQTADIVRAFAEPTPRSACSRIPATTARATACATAFSTPSAKS